ncbi:hypothetical protein [Rhodoferax sp.]|uniref:hypothetical protein n=1 Tax=Rhodoferax sp. TaxID=50421 RepID=UPI0025EDCAE9|nr:hypothetical protein [Rhodoferax sp.]MCM2340645.1 hypothetical protein [Rhodoferax sp.]
MRIIFGVLSLLIVVAVVGTLAKKQLTGGSAINVSPQNSSDISVPTPLPGATAQQQSQQIQQIQQQIRQSLEASMQQARPATGDQ